MNRIELSVEDISYPSSTAGVLPSYGTRDVPRERTPGVDAAPHATFAPIHYEAEYAYPLVVWLHGPSANEQQLRRIMPRVSMRNYVAVAPRGTSAVSRHRNAFRWAQSERDIESAEALVADSVAIARRRFNIHSNRVFLVGLGCGGTMALRIAWNNPHQFAGVATIGGPLPNRNRPFRQVNAMRHLPCFLATGRCSGDYPEADVCRDLRLMHSAGCTVALRQYPCGDELTTQMLVDLDRWMMGIVCAPQA